MQYSVNIAAVKRAGELGLSHDALMDALRKSARITHPKGNRRFHKYLFMLEGNKLVDVNILDEKGRVGTPTVENLESELTNLQKILADALDTAKYCLAQLVSLKKIQRPEKKEPDLPAPIGCTSCDDTGRVRVFDNCNHCEGDGCAHCDGGLVASSIPCPMCTNRRQGKLNIAPKTMR